MAGGSPRLSARLIKVTRMEPFARGRDADVFALNDGRVLRRYRDGGSVEAEATTMAYVAGHGYPVPTVFEAAGADLVMERLVGPTLLSATLTGRVDTTSAARTLAELHNRLSGIPTREPEHAILHLDLHPDNVILTDGGPVVIDWRNTTEGPPALDAAMTAVILAQAAVGEDPTLAGLAAPLLPEFLAAVATDPLSQLDRALALRGANPNLTPAEFDALGSAGDLVRGRR